VRDGTNHSFGGCPRGGVGAAGFLEGAGGAWESVRVQSEEGGESQEVATDSCAVGPSKSANVELLAYKFSKYR